MAGALRGGGVRPRGAALALVVLGLALGAAPGRAGRAGGLRAPAPGGAGGAGRGAAPGYVLVLDCGSTGSRVSVWRYSEGPGGRLPDLMRLSPQDVGFVLTQRSAGAPPAQGQYKDRVEVRPGLPEAVGAGGDAAVSAYLAPLLDWGRAAVPWGLHHATPVLLLGTAGMRRLSAERQEELLEPARRVLGASGFFFEPEYARVLSGAEEGAYGWLALNFMERRLLPEAGPGALALAPAREMRLLGALDMGGSSVEVTHIPMTPAGIADWGAAEQNVTLFGRSYPLSVHTLRGAGLGEAFLRGVQLLLTDDPDVSPGKPLQHPCLQEGYRASFETGAPGNPSVQLQGAFNAQRCASLARRVVGQLDPMCLGSGVGELSCVAAGSGSAIYVGLSGFYVVYSFFDLDLEAGTGKLSSAGEAFCKQPWESVQASRADVMSLEAYCFRSYYVTRLLSQLKVADRFRAAELEGWAMGAALLAAGSTRHLRESLDLGSMVAATATDISAMRLAASSMQKATTQELQLLIAAIVFFSLIAACQYAAGRSQRRRMEQLSLQTTSAGASWLGSDPRELELGRVPSAPKRSFAHKRCASRDDVRLIV